MNNRLQRFLVPVIGVLLLITPITAIFAQPGGDILSGTVTDSAGGKPLTGVSVFLNNTSRGTTTGAAGSFMLNIPTGKYQLVFSAIGYETYVFSIDASHLPQPLKVVLRQKATELSAFTVEPFLKDGWEKWGKVFLDNFIGAAAGTGSCEIKNKGVLRFRFLKKSNRLLVSATEPLIIENKLLGYNLQYQLEQFSCDFSSKIVYYYGYPLFREMTAKNKGRLMHWTTNRKTAYLGSIMHFMRSLYTGHLPEAGFTAIHPIRIPNREKERVRGIYNPNQPVTDTILETGNGRITKKSSFSWPSDSLHHFWKVLREPDMLERTVRMNADSLLTQYADHTTALFFSGLLTIVYQDSGRLLPPHESVIRLITPAMVFLEANGNYYPPQEILSSGFWGQSEKIANLLPFDYNE